MLSGHSPAIRSARGGTSLSRRMRSAVLRAVYALAAVALVAGAFFVLRQSLPELQRKRVKLGQIEKQNAEIEREIQLKKDYVREFDTNPEVPKTLIREKLDRYQSNTREYRYKVSGPRE